MKIFSCLALILLLALMGCKDNEPAGPETYQVKYSVTGSATKVDITYENEDGGTSQVAGASVPWSYSFTGEKGDFVYISAQNQDSTGTVTVTIYRDGDTFKTSTSSGAYVIATASGTL
jgi:hypothetical protein